MMTAVAKMKGAKKKRGKWIWPSKMNPRCTVTNLKKGAPIQKSKTFILILLPSI